MATLVRQGDVLLVPVDALPEGATEAPRDKGRLVLAYGEVTGHAHVIDAPEATATMFTAADNVRFLRILAVSQLVHEEHGAIAVEPGIYRLPPQVEWADSMEPRRVLD